MFEDTLEPAENKLLLLYILDHIKLPMSKNQITEIVLENNFLNYFTLQQYISELISAGFIEYITVNNKNRLTVTSRGHKVLDMFLNRLSKDKTAVVDKYIEENIDSIKQEIELTADYTIASNDSFVVSLKASERGLTLIDLKLNVPSNRQARELCTKWKNNSSDLYNQIINVLIHD